MTEPVTPDAAPRPDLAAMLAPLVRRLVAAELPVLRGHGLSMWAYAVLLGLGGEPVRTQAALARAIGADKTRIIGVLDDLQQRGLIDRSADPADRRVHLLSLTPAGRRLRAATQADIQRGEQPLLDLLTPPERDCFLGALRTLSAAALGEDPW